MTEKTISALSERKKDNYGAVLAGTAEIHQWGHYDVTCATPYKKQVLFQIVTAPGTDPRTLELSASSLGAHYIQAGVDTLQAGYLGVMSRLEASLAIAGLTHIVL